MTSEKPAVFLDRDGVLIEDAHYLSDLSQVEVYEDVPQGLLKLKNAGFFLVVVTNQSGIARGYFNDDFVNKTHRYLSDIFANSGVSIDQYYFCPHHIDGQPPLNIKCECRKPATGMIQNAAKDFPIDIASSFVVGDKISDIELGINCGANSLLVKTGKGAKHAVEVQKRYPQIPIFENFSRVVDYIVGYKIE